MTVLNDVSKIIPVTMCGKNKNSHHGIGAFDTVVKCVGTDEVSVKNSSDTKAA